MHQHRVDAAAAGLRGLDRFQQARDAYERATKLTGSPNAWIGLARASDRLGDAIGACAAYTRARAMPGLPTTAELEVSLWADDDDYLAQETPPRGVGAANKAVQVDESAD